MQAAVEGQAEGVAEEPHRAWSCSPGMPSSTAVPKDIVARSMPPGLVSSSQAHDTLVPCRTADAARFRASGVMKFSVPRSSRSPQRPQFDSESI